MPLDALQFAALAAGLTAVAMLVGGTMLKVLDSFRTTTKEERRVLLERRLDKTAHALAVERRMAQRRREISERYTTKAPR